MSRDFANMNPIENVWNIMTKENGNHMVCKKNICRSDYGMRNMVKCSTEHPGRTLQFNAKGNCRS